MPRTIHLSPDFEETLDRLVAGGRYGGESDVVMYALARLQDDEAVRAARGARLMAQIEEGMEDIRAGRTYPAEEVFAKLREMIDRVRSSREAAE